MRKVIDMPMNRTPRPQGFTLIELMIVIAIAAILAAIAYPSYRDFVRRSDRADAKSTLLQDAQFMERNFTLSNSYRKDNAGNLITASSLPYAQSPHDGTAKYTITVSAPNSSMFTLSAVPTGSESDDPCGTLSLNYQGLKTASGSLSADQCWNH